MFQISQPLPISLMQSITTIHLLDVKLDICQECYTFQAVYLDDKRYKTCQKGLSKSSVIFSFRGLQSFIYAVLQYALPIKFTLMVHSFNATFAFHLATKRIEENGCTLYTGSTPLLPPGVMSLGACKLVSTTLLHVLPSGALGRWASMAKV